MEECKCPLPREETKGEAGLRAEDEAGMWSYMCYMVTWFEVSIRYPREDNMDILPRLKKNNNAHYCQENSNFC